MSPDYQLVDMTKNEDVVIEKPFILDSVTVRSQIFLSDNVKKFNISFFSKNVSSILILFVNKNKISTVFLKGIRRKYKVFA